MNYREEPWAIGHSSHVTLHREFRVTKLYGLLAVNVNNRDFYVTPVRDDRHLPATTQLAEVPLVGMV